MYFRNIIGHQAQIQQLKQDINTGNLAHAYLFAGPADLGKFTIAKAFAKAVQTAHLDDEKIDLISRQIDKGIHLDTMMVARSPEEESIKIATIRSVLNNLQMTGDSQQRILVMEDIDRLTPEAANAMLKMIEEPPSKVIFIFTSSHPNLILETILSRVRRMDFCVMEDQALLAALSNRYRVWSEQQLKRVAELSMGRIAKAVKLVDNPETLAAYESLYLQISGFLAERDIPAAFAMIGQLHSDKVLTEIFLEIVCVVLRNDLKKAIMARQEGKELQLVGRVEKMFKLRELAETNVNNRLLLENFILSI